MFRLLLKAFELGASGFGGLAILGYIKREFVEKEKIVNEREFYEGLSVAQFVPGTTAGNLISHIAYKKGKSKLMYLMSYAFLIPAIISMLLLTYVDTKYGEIDFIMAINRGLKITVVILLLNTIVKVLKPYFKKRSYLILSGIALGLSVININVFVILLSISAINYLTDDSVYPIDHVENESFNIKDIIIPILFFTSIIIAYFFKDNLLWELYINMSKIGFLCFGGGVAAISLINEIVVEQYNWLTKKEILKGIALAQMTPGPILNISVYIGYKLQGLVGSIVASVAMFTPGIVLMQFFALFHKALFNNVRAKKIANGILVAFNGIIINVLLMLLFEAVGELRDLFFLILLLIINFKFKINVICFILLSGIMSYFYYI